MTRGVGGNREQTPCFREGGNSEGAQAAWGRTQEPVSLLVFCDFLALAAGLDRTARSIPPMCEVLQ